MRFFLFAWVLLLAGRAAGEEQPVPSCADVSSYVYKIALYGPGTTSGGRPAGFGGGLFIARNGIFLTARHVFEEASDATRAVVEVVDGSNWTECPVEKVVSASPELDIVLVQVRLDAAQVKVPQVAGSVRVGDRVQGFRVAPPLPAPWRPFTGIVCTSGWVSAVSPRRIRVRGDDFFLPGSSGSPVFNAEGKVVAVALEMINWNGSGKPDWTYTGLPIRAALSVPRLAKPMSVTDFLADLRRSR